MENYFRRAGNRQRTDSNAQPINIGTGGAQRAITIGNSTGNTEITLNAGTSGIDMDTNGEINIATSKDGASAGFRKLRRN